jgi:hypothetical protein
MFDGRWAVNPVARQFSRAAGSCDKTDFAGTSSRRTQLFTFQGALNQAITGPVVARFRGKPFSEGVSILPAFHPLSTPAEPILIKIFATVGAADCPGDSSGLGLHQDCKSARLRRRFHDASAVRQRHPFADQTDDIELSLRERRHRVRD